MSLQVNAVTVPCPAPVAGFLGASAPPRVTAIGNLEILSRTKLALMCSVRCPGRIILRAYDLAQSLRQSDLAIVGGFHSPMEKECLDVLLRGPEPVIVCPAREVEGMRLPSEWHEPLEAGRLLVLSGFEAKADRVTAETAAERNRFVAALADALFVAHADPGGRTEALCRQAVAWGKPIYTFDDPANSNLLSLGALPRSGRGGEWVSGRGTE